MRKILHHKLIPLIFALAMALGLPMLAAAQTATSSTGIIPGITPGTTTPPTTDTTPDRSPFGIGGTSLFGADGTSTSSTSTMENAPTTNGTISSTTPSGGVRAGFGGADTSQRGLFAIAAIVLGIAFFALARRLQYKQKL